MPGRRKCLCNRHSVFDSGVTRLCALADHRDNLLVRDVGHIARSRCFAAPDVRSSYSSHTTLSPFPKTRVVLALRTMLALGRDSSFSTRAS